MVTATGVLLSVVLPLPSGPEPQAQACPLLSRARREEAAAATARKVTPAGMVTATGVLLLDPQAQACPLLSRARHWPPPVATARKVTPAGMLTATGVLLLVVLGLPLPSWPEPLYPQAQACPLLSRARRLPPPAGAALKVTPAGMLPATGVLLLVVLPLPSSPYQPPPQAQACPLLSRARLSPEPAATALKVTPAGMVTVTGVLLLAVAPPLPSSPSRLFPQAQACPLLSRARLCWPSAETALKVTPAGMLTATGVLLAVVLPLPSWPK